MRVHCREWEFKHRLTVEVNSELLTGQKMLHTIYNRSVALAPTSHEIWVFPRTLQN